MGTANAHAAEFGAYEDGFVESGECHPSERHPSSPPAPAPRRRPATLVRAFGESGPAAANERVAHARRLADRSPPPEPTRWEGFLALAEARGVSAAEVAARFTADDIADLCAPEHDDAALARCMDTVAEAVRRERVLAPTAPARQVRCADCHHFRRRPSHPHLGDCAGGGSRTAAGGFWDEQRRSCAAFVG